MLKSKKLYFTYAAMNAGKSTALLQVAHNYEEKKLPVRLFTFEKDLRYGKGLITSRIGIQKNAETFNENTNFLDILLTNGACEHLHCVLIDEAQFLTNSQVKQLHEISHHQKGCPILCYGIRTDFQGNSFEGSSALLSMADELDELKTICDCGKKATMNIRVDSQGFKILEGSQVLIGGNSLYRSVCGCCFYKLKHPV